MKLIEGRLVYPTSPRKNEIFFFTSNSYVKNNGALAMGAGCAKAVRDLYKGIDKNFGEKVDHLSTYGLRYACPLEDVCIGAFQTKVHWAKNTPQDVLTYSIAMLGTVANLKDYCTFHLPFPAVNNGGWTVERVLPLLQDLPDNVLIYRE